MADSKIEDKAWNEMTYRELTHEALIEHAISLSDTDPEKSLEAIAYLEELMETAPVTAAERAEKRRELESKTRKKRDKQSGELIATDKPLYSAMQIKKMLDEMRGEPKYNPLKIKQMYCERYYPEILSAKKKTTIQDMLAAARAKVKAKM